MSLKNVTIKIDQLLLKSLRVLAAARDQSLSELIAELGRKTLALEPKFRARRKRFRSRLEKGFPLNTHGNLSLTREEMHER